MSSQPPIRLGLVGVAGRGKDLLKVVALLPDLRLTAACDIDPTALARACADFGGVPGFTSLEAMLASGTVDAVLIGTPMGLHAAQAAQCLAAGVHVLSEVTACMSVAEAQALVRATTSSRAIYMMAENYIYRRDCMLVAAMMRAGVFGKPYYAEGEYLHDCRELFVSTPWRTGVHGGSDGITYPTHSLGPVLQWFPGERVTAVMCAGSGRNHPDPAGGTYVQQAPCVMLCRMSGGGLVKIRVDILSERPHAMHNYQLQGSEGAYDGMGIEYHEAQVWTNRHGRRPQDTWHKGPVWDPLRSMEELYLPSCWKNATPAQMATGHGGGDYFQFLDFVTAVRGGANRIDVFAALDMTLPGILSQASIAQGSAWIEVPDPRSWA